MTTVFPDIQFGPSTVVQSPSLTHIIASVTSHPLSTANSTVITLATPSNSPTTPPISTSNSGFSDRIQTFFHSLPYEPGIFIGILVAALVLLLILSAAIFTCVKSCQRRQGFLGRTPAPAAAWEGVGAGIWHHGGIYPERKNGSPATIKNSLRRHSSSGSFFPKYSHDDLIQLSSPIYHKPMRPTGATKAAPSSSGYILDMPRAYIHRPPGVLTTFWVPKTTLQEKCQSEIP
ncbi:uncharacterized protein LY89DRAFT_672252 [Mollisia scopiformis]|uniref:Uncharacterized protein n=1 Tax=Mollisia scopiformis TaxID=149040 RepID=A0A194X1B4_MOLSC|nr:uncharacterized protein LY89DRAFT_672252 [Mollisia scopiformis]KUJ13983.1 hypothetical protein LY89DRAFT_672252 [Mollisia scopiformis]